MLEQDGGGVARVRALSGMVLAGAFVILFVIATIRLVSQGAWVEALVAAALLAWLIRTFNRWLRRWRRRAFFD